MNNNNNNLYQIISKNYKNNSNFILPLASCQFRRPVIHSREKIQTPTKKNKWMIVLMRKLTSSFLANDTAILNLSELELVLFISGLSASFSRLLHNFRLMKHFAFLSHSAPLSLVLSWNAGHTDGVVCNTTKWRYSIDRQLPAMTAAWNALYVTGQFSQKFVMLKRHKWVNLWCTLLPLGRSGYQTEMVKSASIRFAPFCLRLFFWITAAYKRFRSFWHKNQFEEEIKREAFQIVRNKKSGKISKCPKRIFYWCENLYVVILKCV